MSKKIYLVRHGQSEANAAGRIQGWLDSPLDELGRQQARQVADRLVQESRPHIIFSSPLLRAAQTAQIISARLDCPLNFDDDLREYNMGPITGLTETEIKERFPARYLAFERNEPLPHLPGAECEATFLERVGDCMARILQQLPDQQTALVVAHGGTLNACLINWLGIGGHSRRPFSFYNASMSLVEVNTGNNKRIIYLNDTCHLGRKDGAEGINE